MGESDSYREMTQWLGSIYKYVMHASITSRLAYVSTFSFTHSSMTDDTCNKLRKYWKC